jgi:hypothetical protein
MVCFTASSSCSSGTVRRWQVCSCRACENLRIPLLEERTVSAVFRELLAAIFAIISRMFSQLNAVLQITSIFAHYVVLTVALMPHMLFVCNCLHRVSEKCWFVSAMNALDFLTWRTCRGICLKRTISIKVDFKRSIYTDRSLELLKYTAF